jgi:hypothetical protein
MSGIISHPSNKNYRDNYDKVFKKCSEEEDVPQDEEQEEQEKEEDSDE